MEKLHLKALPSHIPPVYQTLERVVDMSGFVTIDTFMITAAEDQGWIKDVSHTEIELMTGDSI